MSFTDFLGWTFYGNRLWVWILALVIAIVLTVLLKTAKSALLRYAARFVEKTETRIDDMLIDILHQTKFFFILLVSIYAGLQVLTLPAGMTRLVQIALICAFLGQVAIWGDRAISFWLEDYSKRKAAEDTSSVTTIKGVGFLTRLALWSVILLVALDNLGVDVTTLVAGLGVGGIAVALAVQNVLGDLFASLSIILDKPFVLGDFIIVDDLLGTVEHIGLKTTRIRSLSGEQIVFSNNDLLRSRIRNYKRMYERRIVFTVGVTYQTPHEKLEKIPLMVREIVEAQELARFDRAHFKAFGDFSLNFEIVYYVKIPDYNRYMDTQQAINLAIYKRFREEGIEFAYPTQTLFLEKTGH